MYRYNYNIQREPSFNVGAFFAGIAFFAFFAFATGYVANSLLLMGIFKKSGIKAAYAWIPFYNHWKYHELGGVKGYYSVLWLATLVLWPLVLIPFIGLIFAPLVGFVATAMTVAHIIATRNISKKLGRDEIWFTALGVAQPLNIIWALMLIFSENRWEDSKGEPSLADGTILGYVNEEEVTVEEE